MLSRGYYNLSGNSPMLTESEFNTQFYRIKGGGGVPPSPLPPPPSHTHTPITFDRVDKISAVFMNPTLCHAVPGVTS